MHISIDLDLDPREKEQLASILNCNEQDLPTALEPYTIAAIREYAALFLGQRVFTQGADFRSYRLLLLIKEVFKDKIPDEQDVSSLFQTTPSQSRSLLRSVVARYQYELREIVRETLKNVLSRAVKVDESFEITVSSKNVIDSLNQIVAMRADGTIPRVMLKSKSVSTYTMQPSTYHCLCEHFGIQPSTK